MKLLFEQGVEGRCLSILPPCDVEIVNVSEESARKTVAHLPQLSEIEISRHYTKLAKHAYGVNDGFYPLGSCTMKYNPKINEDAVNLAGFSKIHPLQPIETVQGCVEALYLAKQYLCEITGMDEMTFQPAAGAHGEFVGILLMKKYHESRNDSKRTKIIVPDSAHGTNPATAAMAGMTIINIPSSADGCVDLEKLRAVVGEDTAGLMLTNPNTVGIFDKNILEITKIIHDAGGLCYYDGANLNAIMGVVRPGDMGFDCIHLNLHKTFSTPHGGGGPGSGPVGCKEFLSQFLPKPNVVEKDGKYMFNHDMPTSIGQVKAFYGNFLVTIKALTYLITLGKEGIPEASKNAVLNANYMMKLLSKHYTVAYDGTCMHEFVVTLEKEKKEHGFSAMDIAKGLLDHGVHPPTMYFPLIVHEALMIEPTETESKESIDEAAEIFIKVYQSGLENADYLHGAPYHTNVRRVDEVRAARTPVIRYDFNTK